MEFEPIHIENWANFGEIRVELVFHFFLRFRVEGGIYIQHRVNE